MNSVATCPLEIQPAKELKGRWLSDLPLRGGLGEWIPQYVVYQCGGLPLPCPGAVCRAGLCERREQMKKEVGRGARKDYETQTAGSRAVHPIESGINDPTWQLKHLSIPPHSLLFLHRYRNKELGELHLR